MIDENSDAGRTGAVGTAQVRAPNCLKCAYFKVTWDTVFPRACEVFGIKTSGMPSGEVFRATGSNCPAFRLKPGLK